MEPQVPPQTQTSNSSNNKMVLLWMGLIFVIVMLVIGGWWYKQSYQTVMVPVTSTEKSAEASASATENLLKVPLLKHPAVADISVVYTLLGTVGEITKGKLVLISKGAPLTLQLTNTTTYGQIENSTFAADIDQSKVTKGSNVTVFVSFNPSENVIKVTRVLLTPTDLKASTSAKLK